MDLFGPTSRPVYEDVLLEVLLPTEVGLIVPDGLPLSQPQLKSRLETEEASSSMADCWFLDLGGGMACPRTSSLGPNLTSSQQGPMS